MKILIAVVSFLFAALFLSYFGLVAFNVGSFVYENYPIDFSGVVLDNAFYALIVLTVGSLVLGTAFLVSGIYALNSKPRRE